MDKAIADKWVAALRSGKYQQTSRALKDDKGYCCLGVLYEVMGYQPEKGEDRYYYYDGEKSILSGGAQHKAGMRSPLGVYDDFSLCLTELNDAGISFEKIAQVIKDNWETL